MGLLIELLYGFIRVVFLLVSILITFLVGGKVYDSVNFFLNTNNYPCLELISVLAIIIPPLAFIYGVGIKKHFFERQYYFNWSIIIMSFLLGALFTIFPLGVKTPAGLPNTYCAQHTQTEAMLSQLVITGLLISFNAFVGMDAGVFIDKISRFMYIRKLTRNQE